MIVCAAIHITYRNVAGREITAVIPGLRHVDCWELMTTLELPPKHERQEVEGFLDHTGAFLNRRGAYEQARACGQLSATTLESKTDSVLYSEDLY